MTQQKLYIETLDSHVKEIISISIKVVSQVCNKKNNKTF